MSVRFDLSVTKSVPFYVFYSLGSLFSLLRVTFFLSIPFCVYFAFVLLQSPWVFSAFLYRSLQSLTVYLSVLLLIFFHSRSLSIQMSLLPPLLFSRVGSV